MANQSIPTGTSPTLEVAPLLDATSTLKTGVAVKAKVRRQSDGFVFDWSDSTFKVVGSVIQLLSADFTEVDAVNFPGEYSLLFDLASYAGLLAQDVYEVTVIESGTTDVVNLPQTGEVRVGDESFETAEILDHLKNRLEWDFSGAEAVAILYARDGTTELHRWVMTSEGTEKVTTQFGVQTKRGVPA